MALKEFDGSIVTIWRPFLHSKIVVKKQVTTKEYRRDFGMLVIVRRQNNKSRKKFKRRETMGLPPLAIRKFKPSQQAKRDP